MEERKGAFVSKVKIIFVRHGQTDQNLNFKEGEDLDQPLNQTGIKQLEQTRDELAEYHFDAIISSPLQRAYQSAEIINQKHNLEIHIEDDLREFDVGIISAEDWQKRFDIDYVNSDPDKENLKELFNRVYKVIDKIIKDYSGKTVLVVAHGGVQHAFYAYFNKLKWEGNMRISKTKNGEIKEYEMEKTYQLKSKYPNAFYRVSAKAIIMDNQKRVLMVQENYEDGDFDLPGGGIDHGEDFEQALRRELMEEVNFDQKINFNYQILGVETTFKSSRGLWLMNIICKIDFTKLPQFSAGKDSAVIKFFSKEELAKLNNIGAKIAYKWIFGDSNKKISYSEIPNNSKKEKNE